MTAYERHRSLMTNRLMCLIVMGVLLYYFVQSFFEAEPMPIWFPIVMIAMLVGIALLLLWNIKMGKEFDRKQAEIQQQQELLEASITGDVQEAEGEEPVQ